MKQGDFTKLAKAYIHRPAYSDLIIDSLLKHVGGSNKKTLKIADVGAGTGKLTKVLLEKGLSVTAVEPNDAMRAEGMEYTKDFKINWLKGCGEETCLPDSSVDWLIMASSFHWTDPKKSLPEFYRALKSYGYVTLIWNPRDIERSPLHLKIESTIYGIVPELTRVSSGGKGHTKNWDDILTSTGHFKDVIFMECAHEEIMSKERYLGAWDSVNDIRAQAGEERWKKIMQSIEKEIMSLDKIVVPYKMRAWTAQRIN